jgi:putative ABC transport system permease protein
MDMRPRLLLLGRHPVLVTVLIAQLAIGFLLAGATVSALVSLWRAESAPSGIVHQELLLVYPLQFADGRSVHSADFIAVMGAIDGVGRVAAANQSPFGYSSWISAVGITPRPSPQLKSSIYLAGEHWLETIGASMRNGRDFLPSEYQSYSGDLSRLHGASLPVILNASLAQRLYPDTNPLGRAVFLPQGIPLHIVGTVNDVALPMNGRHLNHGTLGLFLPLRMERAADAHFVLRVPAADREAIAREVEHTLRAVYPSWVATAPVKLSSLRAKGLAMERQRLQLPMLAMAGWLVLAVFAFTVAGYWWLHRHPQELSLRRALGASQRQIAAELRLEYLLVTGVGVTVGFALSRLVPTETWPSLADASSTSSVLICVMLVALVQLAVTWPIRKTRDIPPHHVSRSPSVRL